MRDKWYRTSTRELHIPTWLLLFSIVDWLSYRYQVPCTRYQVEGFNFPAVEDVFVEQNGVGVEYSYWLTNACTVPSLQRWCGYERPSWRQARLLIITWGTCDPFCCLMLITGTQEERICGVNSVNYVCINSTVWASQMIRRIRDLSRARVPPPKKL